MRTLIPLAAALLLVGCAPKTETTDSTAAGTPAASTQNEGGVAPMASGAAGGLTPMSGAENVGGGTGGGVASAAKDMARRAAAQPTAPSIPPDSE